MSKDHIPSDFGRTSGYKSDLEVAETGQMVKSINTSFGSKNHNAYVMRKDGAHEHFYYNPKNQKSGWHGHLYETRNNKIPQNVKQNGDNNMQKSNSFLESLKVDQATIDRCNEASKNAEKNNNNHASKNTSNEGGLERGDTGPASHGREGGAYKHGDSSSSHNSSDSGHSSTSNASAGHNSSGGHGNSGQGSGGQGSGGHGSSGGGH